MWPTCVDSLEPFPCVLRDELPEFIIKAFQKQGIVEPQEMLVPIRMIALLGKCNTHDYLDCPNFPEWHLENSRTYSSNPIDYFCYVGSYYWFDFDLIDSLQQQIQLRVVFHEGDADCNDGTWGACWDRNNGELVAHFKSVGDCDAEIEVISSKHVEAYQPHNIWIPIYFDPDEAEDPLPFTTNYFKDLELEKLIGLAMRWCWSYMLEDNRELIGSDRDFV
jgi:hypothetical protein